MNPPIWLGLSSSYSGAAVTVAWHLPLMTLCSLAAAEDYSGTGAVVGMAMREASNVGEVGATIAIDPSL